MYLGPALRVHDSTEVCPDFSHTQRLLPNRRPLENPLPFCQKRPPGNNLGRANICPLQSGERLCRLPARKPLKRLNCEPGRENITNLLGIGVCTFFSGLHIIPVGWIFKNTGVFLKIYFKTEKTFEHALLAQWRGRFVVPSVKSIATRCAQYHASQKFIYVKRRTIPPGIF